MITLYDGGAYLVGGTQLISERDAAHVETLAHIKKEDAKKERLRILF